MSLLFAALLVIGCSSSSSDHNSPSSPAIAASLIQQAPNDEVDVCAEYGKALLTLDTATDGGMDAPRWRAAQRWGTEHLKDLAVRGLGQGKDVQWEKWKSHKASVKASVKPYVGGAPPPDTERKRYRAVIVEATAVGEHGWQQPVHGVTVFCTLHRENGKWRVAQADVQAGS